MKQNIMYNEMPKKMDYMQLYIQLYYIYITNNHYDISRAGKGKSGHRIITSHPKQDYQCSLRK